MVKGLIPHPHGDQTPSPALGGGRACRGVSRWGDGKAGGQQVPESGDKIRADYGARGVWPPGGDDGSPGSLISFGQNSRPGGKGFCTQCFL